MSNVISSSAPNPHLDMSLLHLFIQADIVVQTVLLFLIFASILCWAIIIEKAIYFKRILYRTDQFEHHFWSGQMLDSLYDNLKDKKNHPMAAIFVAAMHEWSRKQYQTKATN